MTGAPGITKPQRITFGSTTLSPRAIDAVVEVLSSGWLTTGPQVADFETDIASFVGARHAVAVSSCTAAIELALRALRLTPGAKVLTSANTFCGAVNAIVHAGGWPVLADVDPRTLMPSPETVAAAARRAGGVDAMVVLHFAGYPAPVEELATAAGLPLTRVIEDAAHALGASVGNRSIGSISAATCFSFYATKNLPIGEGGMVTTDDDDVADFVRRTRLHGMSRDAWKRYLPGSGWRYSVEDIGMKANMTDVQAAIGRAQLVEFPRWQRRRAELADRYDDVLGGLDGLVLPARPPEGNHAWHLYVVRAREGFGIDRDAAVASLAEAGVDCSVHFIPIHHLASYRGLVAETSSDLPTLEAAFPTYFSLPLHQGLDDAAIDRVGDALWSAHRAVDRSSGSSGHSERQPTASALSRVRR